MTKPILIVTCPVVTPKDQMSMITENISTNVSDYHVLVVRSNDELILDFSFQVLNAEHLDPVTTDQFLKKVQQIVFNRIDQ